MPVRESEFRGRARNAPGAVGALVCGLVGIVLLVLLGLVGSVVGLILGATAVVSAHHAHNSIRRSPPGRFTGEGLATAGLVLGIIDVVLCGLLLLFFLGFLAVVMGSG